MVDTAAAAAAAEAVLLDNRPRNHRRTRDTDQALLQRHRERLRPLCVCSTDRSRQTRRPGQLEAVPPDEPDRRC